MKLLEPRVELINALAERALDLREIRVQHLPIPLALQLEILQVQLVPFDRQGVIFRVVIGLLAEQQTVGLRWLALDDVLPAHLQHPVHHRLQGPVAKVIRQLG